MPRPKSKLQHLYDSLPQDAQQSLVHRALIPLIQSVPQRKRKRIIAVAERVQQRHATCPLLDLHAKKQEINAMLKELSKDTKRSYVMDSSNRNELLEEIVASLACWMNDLWTVVYEHNVDYSRAHNCLLFVCTTLERLDSIRMGCKCALNTMYIPVTLRNKKGEVVRKFESNGASRIKDIALFIWRDAFLCMLAYGNHRLKLLVPKMLEDIEENMGCDSLIQMLYGQTRGLKHRSMIDNESDWEDTSDSDESSLPDLDHISGSEESVYEDAPAAVEFGMPDMQHWTPHVRQCFPRLRRHVETALLAAFETAPTRALYDDLVDMSRGRLKRHLLESLNAVATTSPDTFSVALEVYSFEHQLEPVLDLLNCHAHLLRPRDFLALQTATVFLSRHGHGQRALAILETELLDTARAIRHALLQSFSQMETPASRAEIVQIVKMRSGAAGRRARVEAWVDAATTPGVDQPNPMMFAAMVMGIGPMPGLSSDDDPYTYLDLDPNDPDLEDLRAEYRPDLKKRFESWADKAVVSLQNGSASLLTVYRKIIELLPFLRASDVTEEMISRIQDRASKQFVCDGLDALLAFVKVQRRKWRQDVKRREAQEASAAAARTAATIQPSGGAGASSIASSAQTQPSLPAHPLPKLAEASSSRLGKTSDPIPREDSSGPPPLEPVPSYRPLADLHAPQPSEPPTPGTVPGPSNSAPGAPSQVDATPNSPPLLPDVTPPMSLFNFFLGMTQPPTPGGAPQGPPPGQFGGSSVDDVD